MGSLGCTPSQGWGALLPPSAGLLLAGTQEPDMEHGVSLRGNGGPKAEPERPRHQLLLPAPPAHSG